MGRAADDRSGPGKEPNMRKNNQLISRTLVLVGTALVAAAAFGVADAEESGALYHFGTNAKHTNIAFVSEAEIARAMKFALEEHHLVVEGSGAVVIAALLNNRVANLKGPVVAVLSGGNVDLPVLLDVINQRATGH